MTFRHITFLTQESSGNQNNNTNGETELVGYEFEEVPTVKSKWQIYKALLYVSISPAHAAVIPDIP